MPLLRSAPSALLLALVMSPACVMNDGEHTTAVASSDDVEGGEDDGGDSDDCKIEGSVIGEVGARVVIGGTTATFVNWRTKDGEPNEFVGFELDFDGPKRPYLVKAGGEHFVGEAQLWVHPKGTGGAEVSAISYVDLCDPTPDCDWPDDMEPPAEPPQTDDPECVNNSECGPGEFCAEDGSCRPVVIK